MAEEAGERRREENRVRQAQSGLDSAWRGQSKTLRDCSNEVKIQGLRLGNEARKEEDFSQLETEAERAPSPERPCWLKLPLADLGSSEHCLSAPTDTEGATTPKLEPQRRSDTVPDLDRVCWKAWEKNRLARSGGQAAIAKPASKEMSVGWRGAPFTQTLPVYLCAPSAKQVKVPSHLGWDRAICKGNPESRKNGMMFSVIPLTSSILTAAKGG